MGLFWSQGQRLSGTSLQVTQIFQVRGGAPCLPSLPLSAPHSGPCSRAPQGSAHSWDDFWRLLGFPEEEGQAGELEHVPVTQHSATAAPAVGAVTLSSTAPLPRKPPTQGRGEAGLASPAPSPPRGPPGQ